MSQGWRWRSGLVGLALAGGLAGCVERTYLVTTDPPGAVVYENDHPIGAAPVDRPFVYYGKYRFTLVGDGSQTVVVDEYIRAPFYEYPLLDFISENVLPWTIRDKRHFHYVLPPMPIVPPDQIRAAAEALRRKGQDIGVPLPPTAPPTPVPAVAPPPGPIVPPVVTPAPAATALTPR
jgi:hypothetical protein